MNYKTIGSGPPLLLLHGFTGCMRNWEPLVPQLAQNYTVVTVDLPGHGQTASPDDLSFYRIGPVAAELVQLMHSLGHDRFDLIGYSMGGRLALYIACRHPEKISRLILESASPGLKTAEERAARRTSDYALVNRIQQDGVEKFVDFWESIPLWESQKQLSAEARQNLRQIRLDNNPAGLANSLRGMGTGQQPSLWSDLSQLTMPTLLITGEHDHKFCAIAADMQSHIPQVDHQTVKNAGHTVHLEQPSSWLALVGAFL